MNIVEIEIEKLKPYKLNAKTHPQSQIEGIAESLKRFGINQPAVIDKDNEIVVGHGRIEAAKLVGFKTFPCVIKSDLTDQEIKAYRLIDNRIAETPWDSDLLKLDLDVLDISLEVFNIKFDDLVSGWDTNIESIDKIESNLEGIEAVIKIRCPQEQKDSAIKAIDEAFKNAGITEYKFD